MCLLCTIFTAESGEDRLHLGIPTQASLVALLSICTIFAAESGEDRLMRNTLYHLQRYWAGLRRLRHSHGYGVHSPFAFELITQVIRSNGQYYAYRTLAGHYPALHSWQNAHSLACHRFLFRLVNYVHPQLLCLGGHPSESVLAFMQAATPTANIVPVEAYAPMRQAPVVVFLAADCPPQQAVAVAGSVPQGSSVCVVEQIHANAARRLLWERLRSMPQVGATFDLYDYGLLFYDQTRNRQHYLVAL